MTYCDSQRGITDEAASQWPIPAQWPAASGQYIVDDRMTLSDDVEAERDR